MAFFLKLLDWIDDTKDTLVYKYPLPKMGKEINNKSKLTVRESQVAVFVCKGKIYDIFEPGMYSLETQIFPLLSKIAGWKYGFQTPITCDVYYVSTKQFTNNKWGTSNPIMMRDPEFGAVRVRGFGAFAFKVSDPEAFLKEVFGTISSYNTKDITDYLKTIVVAGITDAIGESKISALDLAGNTLEFNEIVKRSIQDKFNEMGLTLTNFFVENMSLPEEVEKTLDERSKLGILGDKTDVMMKIAAAEALKESAKNQGMGGAFMSAGVGASAGVGLGQAMREAFNTSSQTSDSGALGNAALCPKCKAKISGNAKFCPECGYKLNDKKFCPECGAEIQGGAKFCPECGHKMG